MCPAAMAYMQMGLMHIYKHHIDAYMDHHIVNLETGRPAHNTMMLITTVTIALDKLPY